jgi:hypothetical protein
MVGAWEWVEWEEQPPKEVKCVPTFLEHSWVRWDEGMDYKG